MRMRLYISAALAILPMLNGCGGMPTDKKSLTLISASRPLGTKCFVGDSASIKRAAFHPNFPTGGWNDQGNNTRIDYARTLKRDTNALVFANQCISGYVKFDTPGYLQARSYDDYLGDVYCGWSPERLPVKPTAEHVYVSLSLCSVGDGGLDQIHEVAWFPEGAKEGILVFSTAHKCPGQPLSPIDTYRKDQLGNPYWYNEGLAQKVIDEYLRTGNPAGAQEVLRDAIVVLNSTQDYVDGSTGKKVSAKIYNRSQWNKLLLYKLGFSAGSPEFEKSLKEYVENLEGENRGDTSFIVFDKPMIPLYAWLNDRLMDRETSIPKIVPRESTHYSGHDAPMISAYLSGEITEKQFHDSSAPFWIGVKQYLNKDYAQASKSLQRCLDKWTTPFNRACAANLLMRIKQMQVRTQS